MEAVSMNTEVRKAGKKFEDEFKFSEMETMIHQFPAALGHELSSRYSHMVSPRFVAIGPYHHGEKQLEKMEEVKSAAAYYLCQRMDVEPDAARDAVLAVVDKARTKYYYHHHDIDDAAFAAMMFRDACFLLLYMDAHNRSYGDREDDVVNMSMRRFLFSNRDSINSDIMLLENQLPWVVIRALVDLAATQSLKLRDELYQAVGRFIAGIGNDFKITVSRDDMSATYVWDEENNPPSHLLALLRRYKTESAESAAAAANNQQNHGVLQLFDAPSTDLHRPLIIHQPYTPPPAVNSISSMSPVNLQEIGINLTARTTAACWDMGLEKGPVVSRLAVVPLSLSETKASYLVNMAALEVCTASRFGDDPEKTAVCSYLALLANFMVGPEDVRRLRSIGILHGPLSDGDMLAFFNAIAKHLPNGKHFSYLMAQIEEYKQKRPIRTTLYRWVYNNKGKIAAVVSLILTLIALYQALLTLIH